MSPPDHDNRVHVQTLSVMKPCSRDRQILSIALPSIVSNITVPLLGLVDVAIVGHIGDAVYIGAIAVGSMMFSLIYWVFGFLRMGTSGMTSQAYGARNLAETTRLLVRSLLVAFGVAALILIIQTPLLWLMMRTISPTPDVEPLARTYFSVCVWGAPAMLGLYALSGWFIGMQNTRIPMFISIMQNVVNIIASLTLVYCFGMRLEGVAMGTLIAQWSGFIAALLLLIRYYGRLRSHFTATGLLGSVAMRRFFSVNRDIFLRTLFLVGVNLYFTSAGARQGAVVLAVNTMLMQLYLLFSYIMDGFAYAGEAIGGRYYGARNATAFKSTVTRLFLWGAIMATLFTIVYAAGGRSFLSLLTSDADVVTASMEYFPWAVAIPFVGVAAFVWDGIFIGMTATRSMLTSSVVAATCFFAVYTLLHTMLGNHALWLAMLFFLGMRGVVQTIIFLRSAKCHFTVVN